MKKFLIFILLISFLGCSEYDNEVVFGDHASKLKYYKKHGKYIRAGTTPANYHYIHIKPEDICEKCLHSKKYHMCDLSDKQKKTLTDKRELAKKKRNKKGWH